MNTSTRNIGLSVFAALSAVALSGQPTKAQQVNVGQVLGAEVQGDFCNIALLPEGSTEIITQSASADTCEQILVGNKIEYASEITQVSVIEPPKVATVEDVSIGDRACYITLKDESGSIVNQFARFSVCDSSLIGQSVQLTYGTASLNAFSCGGDLECGKSEQAAIILTADVIDPQPTTPTPTAQPFISDLPDGNYRFWNGEPTDGIVSDDDLLASGERTLVVRFRKQGNNFTGIFGYISDDTICVQGQINENTVTGISIQSAPEIVPMSTGETFESFNASDRLMLRRGRQVGTETINANGTPVTLNVIRYNSTILDLSGLNRINAGTRVPPQKC